MENMLVCLDLYVFGLLSYMSLFSSAPLPPFSSTQSFAWFVSPHVAMLLYADILRDMGLLNVLTVKLLQYYSFVKTRFAQDIKFATLQVLTSLHLP
jgi:hypothetical protein